MSHFWRTCGAALLLLTVLAACGDSATPNAATPTSAATTAADTTAASGPLQTIAALPTSAPITAIPPGAAPLTLVAPSASASLPIIAQVVADLAKRKGIASSDIQVESLLPHTWADGSLGCPAPGQMYSQIVTPGYLITLTSGGQLYRYHTTTTTTAILCGPDNKPVP